jgi:hypothetical protein
MRLKISSLSAEPTGLFVLLTGFDRGGDFSSDQVTGAMIARRQPSAIGD